MKITKSVIRNFKRNQNYYGTRSALSDFVQHLSDTVDKPVRRCDAKQFDCDEAEYGIEVALFNVVWNAAADLLHDIGVTHIETSTWRKILPPAKKGKINPNDVAKALKNTKQKAKK